MWRGQEIVDSRYTAETGSLQETSPTVGATYTLERPAETPTLVSSIDRLFDVEKLGKLLVIARRDGSPEGFEPFGAVRPTNSSAQSDNTERFISFPLGSLHPFKTHSRVRFVASRCSSFRTHCLFGFANSRSAAFSTEGFFSLESFFTKPFRTHRAHRFPRGGLSRGRALGRISFSGYFAQTCRTHPTGAFACCSAPTFRPKRFSPSPSFVLFVLGRNFCPTSTAKFTAFDVCQCGLSTSFSVIPVRFEAIEFQNQLVFKEIGRSLPLNNGNDFVSELVRTELPNGLSEYTFFSGLLSPASLKGAFGGIWETEISKSVHRLSDVLLPFCGSLPIAAWVRVAGVNVDREPSLFGVDRIREVDLGRRTRQNIHCLPRSGGGPRCRDGETSSAAPSLAREVDHA